MPRPYRRDIRLRDDHRGYGTSHEMVHSHGPQQHNPPKFDRFSVLIIAAVVAAVFHFFLITNGRNNARHNHILRTQDGRTYGTEASQFTDDMSTKPVNATEVQSQIDPNFASYLHMLAKKEADVLTGRRFLSVGSENDGENEDSEEAGNSKRNGISKSMVNERSIKLSSSTGIVRLPSIVQDGYNITRVSQMLLRVILTQNVYSMVVVPCEKHMSWMGRFLEGTSAQLPKPFLFYCVDSNKRAVKEAEENVGEIDGVNTNFVERQFWNVPLPRAELVFSWDGLDELSILHAHKLLDTVIRQSHHKMVLLGSTPSTKQNSDRAPLNLRRSPFSYTRPWKIFKELYSDESLKGADKQLYLYQVGEMKKKHKKGH